MMSSSVTLAAILAALIQPGNSGAGLAVAAPSPCFHELMDHCSTERAACEKTHSCVACDDCVKKVPLGPKTDGNCTSRQEMAFCETMRPDVSKCELELRKVCAVDVGNQTKCDKCVRNKVDPAWKCTAREELAFCERRPAPTWGCERDLEKLCGAERREGEEACDKCVRKVDRKLKNCTKREELTFCNATHPPTPGPVSRECEEALRKDCVSARRESQHACDLCVEKVGPKEHCTEREELSFCNATRPHPVDDQCEEVLKKDCEASKGKGVKACDECVAAVDKRKLANCTRRDALVFCGGPAPTPGPVSDKCEKLLKTDCPPKPELLCDKCAEQKGGECACDAAVG
jgi:hypothetical protein